MMFAHLFLVTLAVMPLARGFCTASLSSDRLAGCAFNPLLLVVERSGWVLSRQNCGETVDPTAFDEPAILYYDLAEPDHLYTVAFVEEPDHRNPNADDSAGHYLRWLVVNVPESSLTSGMRYMDGDTIVDYLSPALRPAGEDDGGDADGQPTRYAFYLYEQVYGTVYPPTPSTRAHFDLDGWISTIYPAAALCGPVASIGFGSDRQ